MVFIKLTLLLSTCFILYACGTTDTSPVSSTVNETDTGSTALMATSQYIPKQKTNRKGELIPYEPIDNPYLKRQPAVKKVHLALFLAAKRAYEKSNWDEAESILEDLVVQTNRLSGPWVMLSDIALKKNQLSEAHDHLKKAITINKKNINAYLRLAKIQRLQGDYIEAQHTYAQLLSIWPDFPEAHLNLGVLYDVYLNNPIQAKAHMQAYQFLAQKENEQVSLWIKEIQERTKASTPEPNAFARTEQELETDDK